MVGGFLRGSGVVGILAVGRVAPIVWVLALHESLYHGLLVARGD